MLAYFTFTYDIKGFGACSRAHLPPSPHSSSAQVRSGHDRFSFYLVLNMSALGLGQVMIGFPLSCTQYVSVKVRSAQVTLAEVRSILLSSPHSSRSG